MAHNEPCVNDVIKGKKIRKIHGDDMWQGGKVGRKLPHLTNLVNDNQKEKEK